MALLWPWPRAAAGERRIPERGVVLDGVFVCAAGLALPQFRFARRSIA